MTGTLDDAAELTQQAFCRALSNWDQFDGKGLPTTWLHSILVNCVRDWGRRTSLRTRQTLDEWDIIPARDSEDHMLTRLERHEQLATLRAAIEELSPKLRCAFVAAVLDGYSYEEVADLLNVPKGTVASRVNAARERLSAVMRKAYPEA
jgi:RNA polymerase sigma-70 factor (ECF subfamily)